MSKKKEEEIINFGEAIAKALEMFTPQEQEELMSFFLNNGVQELYQRLEDGYCYQQPDYTLEAKPIAPFLQKIWDMETYDDYPLEELQEEYSTIPASGIDKELRNFILNLFINFKEDSEEEKDLHLKLFYIYWLMERYQAESCLETVLEIMRQRPIFLATYCPVPNDAFCIIVRNFGINQLPILLDFMKEPKTLFIGKEYISTAVAQIAIANPDKRQEVIEWFCQLLNFYYDHADDEENEYLTLIDHIAFELKNIGAVETLFILGKIYNRYGHIITNLLVRGGIKELKKEMPLMKPGVLDYKNMDELLHSLYCDTDEFEDVEFDDDIDDSFYVETIVPKKLKLKITLTDSEPEIWRTVEVPSNIRLESFSRVVETAMGWGGYHLHQFRKGNSYYLPDYEREYSEWEVDAKDTSSYSVSLGELLPRKGSWIEYEYDFGDSWTHRITLESKEPYKKTESQAILLTDGANACPPEDCGGIYSYSDLLEALAHPHSTAAQEYKEWLGKGFDPCKFDRKTVAMKMKDFPIAISE